MDLSPSSGNCTTEGVVPSQTFGSAVRVKWAVGSIRRCILPGVLVLLGYYLGAKIGLALTFQPHPVSVMWPPNSILLSALLLSSRRAWWFLLLCAFPAHLITELKGGIPLRMSLCWFVSNCSEALIGAATTRWFVGQSGRFDRMRGLAFL